MVNTEQNKLYNYIYTQTCIICKLYLHLVKINYVKCAPGGVRSQISPRML